MKRFLAATLCALLAACGGSGSSPVPTPATTAPAFHGTPSAQVQHVIIVVQENRSMDYMMHFVPGVDVSSTAINSRGKLIYLHEQSLATTWDIVHEHTSSWVKACDLQGSACMMDGFNNEPNSCPNYGQTCMFAYAPQSEVQPLIDLCAQYTCADRMFQSNQGPSLPAHQYIIAGTSSVIGNTTDPNNTNPASSNPIKGQGGCDADAGSLVNTIDAYGVEGSPVFPCWDHPTLGDSLTAAGVSWKFYQDSSGVGLWHSYDYISHIRYGGNYKKLVDTTSSDVLTDIQNGNLAQVSWVMPSRENSDHASNDSTTGPSWVASIVNAVGTSQYWPNTVILITWDDWGGWYDHVPPPIYNSYELGFRVPLIVVSPYAKVAYVSHTQHEFGSILKFIEENWSLPSLGYSDARADDLLDCFNFTQQGKAFRMIHARYPLSHFLHQPPDKKGADTD